MAKYEDRLKDVIEAAHKGSYRVPAADEHFHLRFVAERNIQEGDEEKVRAFQAFIKERYNVSLLVIGGGAGCFTMIFKGEHNAEEACRVLERLALHKDPEFIEAISKLDFKFVFIGPGEEEYQLTKHVPNRANVSPVVIIMTMIGPEMDAMLKAFTFDLNADRKFRDGYMWFERTVDTTYSGKITLQLYVTGEPNNNVSATDAARLLSHAPKFMLLCGIAAGLKGKVKIGDIVVPRSVVDNTTKVAKGGEMLPRPKMSSPLKGVLQMNAVGKIGEDAMNEQFERIFGKALVIPKGKEGDYEEHVGTTRKVHEVAILSDSILMRDPSVMDKATELHQHIQAAEMEAAGFVQTCSTHYPPVPWFVVRGISDFGDDFKNDLFHAMAASAAAAYTYLYLTQVIDLRIWQSN